MQEHSVGLLRCVGVGLLVIVTLFWSSIQYVNMTGCSANNCHNSGVKGFVLCRFPRDPALRNLWMVATGRQNWSPKNSNSLCEDHFLLSDWAKYRVSLKPGAIPSVFCNCQDNQNLDPGQPVRSHLPDHTYISSRKVLGDLNRQDEHCYSSRSATQQPKRVRKRTKTHAPDCNVVRNKNFISSSLKSTLPSFPGAAVSSYQQAVRPRPENSTVLSLREDSVVLPPREDSVGLPPQEDSVALPPREDSVGLPPREDSVGLPPREDSVVLPPREDSVGLPPREDSVALLPEEPVNDLLLQQLNDKVKENARLEKEVARLKKQLAAVKQQRDDLKSAQKKFKKDIDESKKKEAKLTEDHNRLSDWLHSKFSERQIKAAMEGVTRGEKWDDASVKAAIRMKCAGGTSGLRAASDFIMTLPSPRTVRRRIAHLKFQPGIQNDVLDEFAKLIAEEKLKSKNEMVADCLLFFDEMSIKAGIQYDKGVDHYIGSVTLPGVNGVATKAQAFLFGGVASKWKVVAAYHFIPSESHPQATKVVIDELLHKGKSIGLFVLGIVCDMGNRSLLKALGFSTKKDEIIYAIPNPADPQKYLYCIPDIVHVFKSAKEMLCNNPEISLPEDVVNVFELPSRTVKVDHIDKLCQFDEGKDLQLHPRLSRDDVHSKHFNKMKVAPATHVLGHMTAKAMEFLALKQQLPEESATTAWFCELLQKWFTIMTSRSRQVALSHHNADAYNQATAVLRLVVYVFTHMRVGSGWKPVQTHLIMATTAILELAEYLLSEKKYDFVLIGRFLQDIVENLFSLIRISRPNPTAVELKYRLRAIVLSQFSQLVPNSSYSQDDRLDVLENILLRPQEAPQPQRDTSAAQRFLWVDPPEDFLTEVEDNILYRMCGYVVKCLIDSKQVKCDECLESLKSHERIPASFLTLLTDYKPGAQVQVSRDVFRLCKFVEFNLQRWKALIATLKSSFADALEQPLKQISSNLPTCHNLTYVLLKRFSAMRMKQFTTTSKQRQKDGSQLASKSMGSRYLADNFAGERRKK